MTFGKMAVAEFLDALASPEPTPGGGTASAIVGAMGTSLLVMVTGLAKSRTNTDDEKAALATARQALMPIGALLSQLADADTAAFNDVMAAYRLPKATDEEKLARTAAIQTALQGATIVPLRTLRACADAMGHAVVVAEHGNRSASSDAGVAIGLLEAAAAGADANVRINLASIRDAAFTGSTSDEAGRLASALTTQGAAARALLA